MPVSRARLVKACRSAAARGMDGGGLLRVAQRLTDEKLQKALINDDDRDGVLVGWLEMAGQCTTAPHPELHIMPTWPQLPSLCSVACVVCTCMGSEAALMLQ